MMRFQNWPERLAAFFDVERSKPFAWGTTDCITLAAGAVETMTGIDPIADIRGTWNDEESAVTAVSRIVALPEGEIRTIEQGLGDAVDKVLSVYGAVELVSTRLVGRGDIVTVSQTGLVGCGVVAGSTVACRGKTGFAWLRPGAITRAWRI